MLSEIGPSPRLRGKLVPTDPATVIHGSIPAPAGETFWSKAAVWPSRVHPRACGGNFFIQETPDRPGGPSPRLRGKPFSSSQKNSSPGSIPAPAGETLPSTSSRARSKVHPRACGGNDTDEAGPADARGPSPRLRGKRVDRERGEHNQGSIPAPAGETALRSFWPTRSGVHPRACGGNGHPSPWWRPAPGPSPRLRGKRLLERAGRALNRSIPAPAGETLSENCKPRSQAVHPRACGGNPSSRRRRGLCSGPSPRLRGKPDVATGSPHGDGSIPAPAGETYCYDYPKVEPEVHPRACGGNRRRVRMYSISRGPSPRLRGKPTPWRVLRASHRSIPAPAGETRASRCSPSRTAVHPRACGGNVDNHGVDQGFEGPSPRLRGKPAGIVSPNGDRGSIPAPAGETSGTPSPHPPGPVHPRACGGNQELLQSEIVGQGPSPRLRGKRRQVLTS